MSRYLRLALRVVLLVGALVFFGSRAASAAEGDASLDATGVVSDVEVATPLTPEPVEPAAAIDAVVDADLPAPEAPDPSSLLPTPEDDGAAVVDLDVDLAGTEGLEAPDVPELVVPGTPGSTEADVAVDIDLGESLGLPDELPELPGSELPDSPDSELQGVVEDLLEALGLELPESPVPAPEDEGAAVVDVDVDLATPDELDGFEAPEVPELVVPGTPGTVEVDGDIAIDLTGAPEGDLDPVTADLVIDLDGFTGPAAPPVPLPEPLAPPASDGQTDLDAVVGADVSPGELPSSEDPLSAEPTSVDTDVDVDPARRRGAGPPGARADPAEQQRRHRRR